MEQDMVRDVQCCDDDHGDGDEGDNDDDGDGDYDEADDDVDAYDDDDGDADYGGEDDEDDDVYDVKNKKTFRQKFKTLFWAKGGDSPPLAAKSRQKANG